LDLQRLRADDVRQARILALEWGSQATRVLLSGDTGGRKNESRLREPAASRRSQRRNPALRFVSHLEALHSEVDLDTAQAASRRHTLVIL
jgi:hypothetical protein